MRSLHFSRYLGVLAASITLAAIAAPKPAEPVTAQANQAVLQSLPFADTRAFDDARRGFIAALPDGQITDSQGNLAWNMAAYAFLDKEQAPDTVNPSLWRQARLNAIHGLFEVVEGMYQIRGMDLANMTIVEGDTGLIIIDPLLTPATARAGLELYYQHRPQKPVVAVLYTHNHADHFGGVKGVIDEADVRAGKVRVYAPEGFMQHAVSENVIAGNAMGRRATYQFGALLPPGERGHVDTGLGKALAKGPISLIAPTDTVPDDASLTIDGIDIEFQMAHGTEAESEMMMYFPQFKVLNTAEITSQHLHNIYTIRGAAVRDASAWSRYIDRVLERFGDQAEILVAQHHWPIWTRDEAKHFLAVQRDLYKFIHDQSVRMRNAGKTIAYMGGIDRVMAQAREDYAKGEFRWVAWVMSQAVFAEPDNQAARQLAADALEQLGYQAEAGTWRGAYLMGAQELRNGPPPSTGSSNLSPDVLQALETGMFFDLLAVRLDADKAAGKHLLINWKLTDVDEQYRLNLQNATLTYRAGSQADNAHATVSMTRATLNDILLRQSTFPEAVKAGHITIEGEPMAFFGLLQMVEEPAANFTIVEPVR